MSMEFLKPIPHLVNVGNKEEPQFREISVVPKPDFRQVEFWTSEEKLPFLEQYLKSRYRPQTNSLIVIPEKGSLRQTEEQRPHYLRFATLLEAYEATAEELLTAQSKFEEAEKAYEARKKNSSKFKQKQQIIDEWTNEIKPNLLFFCENAQAEQNLVLDHFLRNFLLSKDGIRHLLDAMTELVEDHSENIVEISNFLSACVQRIHSYRKKTPQHDFDNLSYKKTSTQLFFTDRNDVLPKIVQAAYETPTIKNQSAQDLSLLVQMVAQELLETYWRNVDNIAQEGEVTPLLTFTYDFLLSAGLHDNQDLFFQAIQDAAEWLNSDKRRFAQEYKRAFEISFIEAATLETDYDASGLGQNQTLTHDERTKQFLLERSGHSSYVGKNYEMVSGLYGIFLLAKEKNWLIAASIFNSFNLDNSGVFQQKIIDSAKYNKLAYMLKSLSFENVDIENLERSALQYISRKTYLSSVLHNTGKLVAISPKRENFLEFFVNTIRTEKKKGRTPPAKALNALNYMFAEPDDSPESIRALQENNAPLLDAVNNDYSHFLAYCGDQFPVELNPDLSEYNLEGITFFPVFGRSGEYEIHLQVQLPAEYEDISKKERTVRILLTQDGYLSYPEKRTKSLFAPKFDSERLLSIILPRLHYITSGEFLAGDGVKSGLIKTEAEQRSREVKSIRPHWVLTPLGCTLKSWTALKHQEDVYADYGIDILEENYRRKEKGTLPDDRNVTYNRGFIDFDKKKEPNLFSFPNK